MPSLACLNGELMPVESATVPVWDRGFLFGDAVYEVYRLYGGRPWLEDAHFARLERSLREMEIERVDLGRLRERARRTVAASGVDEGTVYLHVTRGVAPRAHAFPGPEVAPTELVLVRPYDDTATAAHRESGVAVATQPDLRWGRCDVKSTNLLANVLAYESARRAGGYEALLVKPDGRVTEASHSSVLWVRDGRLEGTPEGPGILPGTTRQFVQHLAADLGIPTAGSEIRLPELLACDEVLLAGTTIEVLPVIRVDDHPIGDGRPGPVARRLQEAFRRAVAEGFA